MAVEINGTVSSAVEKYATVVTDSDLIPAPGDKAEIFFKMPGHNVEVSVANGHVYEITGPNIMIEIDDSTATVSKGQLVRIQSSAPKKRSSSEPVADSGSSGETGEPRRGKLLFSEDFASSTEDDGRLRLTGVIPLNRMRYARVYDCTERDFYVEVDVMPGETSPTCHFGLIVRAVQATNEERLDHYESISIQSEPPSLKFICRKTLDEMPETQKLDIPPGILAKSRNRLGIEAVGKTFRVFVNDQFVGTFVNDIEFPAGSIGACMGASEANQACNGYFDDIKVYELASSP